MKSILATALLLALAGSTLAAGNELTYVDLVKRLTDLEHLATLPAEGETCAQCSSYDRASKYDPATGKYIKWDANGDGQGFIRREGDTIVMAEMEGPGCIWRTWSARPQNGHVRIYLDGSPEPAVDLPFIGYFNHQNAPFTGKALVHNVANGENNYVPIPYQKSCKIVADKGWGNYYQFTYSTFPKGTKVPTFKRQLSPEETAALEAVDKALTNVAAGPEVKRVPHAISNRKSDMVRPGQTTLFGEYKADGGKAMGLVHLKFRVEDLPASPADRAALRELVLKITWDDDAAPAVWCPLGDFFGTAPGVNKYQSLPLGMTDDGWMYCYWFMPFGKARIEVSNDGKEPRRVVCETLVDSLENAPDRYMRFHAKWHRDAFLPTEPERQIDWPMLVAEGRGRFVGVMLHVWSPKGGWWGEGDEKFFVDGEKFPSTFGTGSEDYFGYAWSSPKLFQHAYHNQTISQNLRGHISVNRWQIADNVPFQKSFHGYIEKYYPNDRPCLYAAVPYFYLTAGLKDGYQPASLQDRAGYWVVPPTARVPGAIEGESLNVLGKTGGNAGPQDMSYPGFSWSDDRQLWWTGAKPGDKLDLAVPVARAGKYKLVLQLTKARDYGIVQLSLDGQKLGDPIDLFNRGVVPTGAISFGPMDLAAGQHKLTLEITGANPNAVKSYMAGVDYVKVEEQK